MVRSGSGGAWLREVGGPLRIAVVDRADQPPVRAVRHVRRVAQRPAEFLDEPVTLAVVAPHARGNAVLPGVDATAAARDHVIDGLGPVAAVRAHVVVPAHQRAAGERNAAAVRYPDI